MMSRRIKTVAAFTVALVAAVGIGWGLGVAAHEMVSGPTRDDVHDAEHAVLRCAVTAGCDVEAEKEKLDELEGERVASDRRAFRALWIMILSAGIGGGAILTWYGGRGGKREEDLDDQASGMDEGARMDTNELSRNSSDAAASKRSDDNLGTLWVGLVMFVMAALLGIGGYLLLGWWFDGLHWSFKGMISSLFVAVGAKLGRLLTTVLDANEQSD